ncbi:hypothetical protein DERP_012433 [Dermatophagoides pteronyssinus]|uniref:Uncharacterized protein n=1 Tax=Dermatophagoides pteronyssinus TaxID=6956 RepID=A0ABQ8IWZ2_DERPT|nr:hypothetical protein DERP_012433 [Dermatophagoides pteronyssinus]
MEKLIQPDTNGNVVNINVPLRPNDSVKKPAHIDPIIAPNGIRLAKIESRKLFADEQRLKDDDN